MNEYDIIYLNIKITNLDNKSIYEIVGTDITPIFIFQKRGK